MTTDISRLPAGVASPVTFSTGYSATYLGHVPTESSAGREYIEYCIEKVGRSTRLVIIIMLIFFYNG